MQNALALYERLEGETTLAAEMKRLFLEELPKRAHSTGANELPA
jgi:hypothetical protein